MRRSFAVFFLAILAMGVFFGGCSKQPDPWPDKPGKHVLASFPPIYCFAQNVAGDDAVVLCLLAAKGPHEATEWNPEDMLKFRGADLVLSLGLELDDILINKLKDAAGKQVKKDARYVKVGDCIPAKKLLTSKDEEEGNKGKLDPHVWLNPELAIEMVGCIADELSKLDPPHEKGYRERARAYNAKIKSELLDHGLALFEKAKTRNIVTQHDAIQYFAHFFKLNVVGSLRATEGQEIDPAEKAKLIQDCKDKKVGAVTCEPQYPEKDMQSLCESLGIKSKLVVVDPLETAPLKKDGTNPDPALYLKVMRDNIDNLAEKLK